MYVVWQLLNLPTDDQMVAWGTGVLDAFVETIPPDVREYIIREINPLRRL